MSMYSMGLWQGFVLGFATSTLVIVISKVLS